MPRTLPPGPPAKRLLGWDHAKAMQRDILGFARQLMQTYGDAAYFRVGPTSFYQFTHPDVVQEVLVAKAKKLYKPQRLKQIFGKWDGEGLVTSDGELWMRQRRLVQRAFQPSRLQRYAETMSQLTWQALQGWGARREVEINSALNRLTLEIVGQTLFGVQMSDLADKMKHAVDAIQELAMRDFSAVLPTPLWWNRLFDRRAYGAIKLLDDLVWKLIRERRASGEDRGDLLSILLLAVDEEGDGRGMTDRQARDEIVTLLLAGHESTAVTLTWTVYLLAKHQAIQAELAERIDRQLAGRPPLMSDLPQLAPLEAVLKEAMRLYPAVYFLAREAHEAVEIGGYEIPRGGQIHLVPYLVHHDERWWPEPEKFDPARFLPANESAMRPFAYFPFGAGPRGCIGKNFSIMEQMLILATLLQRYHLELAPGQDDPVMETQVSLHPRGGLRILATERRKTVPA